ncbi:potassium channel family protein [uncultured Roseibium sp.]|uniref:potassium channel family protein n=1 Tax=uncultured Roseibium sp. TaxID=1936171 RepID=UPI00321783B4
MRVFFPRLRRLLNWIRDEWYKTPLRYAVGILILVLAGGAFFYHRVEGWSLFDSLYFCVITLATVGYGDYSPKTDVGKLFTMAYVFVGIGLFVGVATAIAQRYDQPHHKQHKADDGHEKGK